MSFASGTGGLPVQTLQTSIAIGPMSRRSSKRQDCQHRCPPMPLRHQIAQKFHDLGKPVSDPAHGLVDLRSSSPSARIMQQQFLIRWNSAVPIRIAFSQLNTVIFLHPDLLFSWIGGPTAHWNSPNYPKQRFLCQTALFSKGGIHWNSMSST